MKSMKLLSVPDKDDQDILVQLLETHWPILVFYQRDQDIIGYRPRPDTSGFILETDQDAYDLRMLSLASAWAQGILTGIQTERERWWQYNEERAGA
jgi:hypothetical protein